MNIIKPEGEATTATATVEGRYVTLTHAGAEIMLPAMARPGNFSESLYWTGADFDFLPSEPPVLAAVLASHAGQLSLTLFALPDAQAAPQATE
ncbi:MAG: hypothetical protein KGZ67_04685 [Hydrogenophaga sp.]|jgi:hypothetical protein|nr:hypothetical protein [Hydrogenophaga sp.]